MLHKLIKFIHVYISEKLGSEVSYGNASAARSAVTLSHKLRFARIAFYEILQKTRHFFVSYSSEKKGEKNVVVNGIEEFFDVAFERVAHSRIIPTFFSERIIEHLHSSVITFSDPTGKRIGNECRLKNGIEHAKDRVVQNPVSHYCLVHMSAFWVCDEKSAIRSMFVCPVSQLPIQLKDMWLKIRLELKNIRAGPFAALKSFPRRKEVFRTNNFIKQFFIFSHRYE